MSNELEQIAIHEAGHAVVAWSLGWRLREVTIVPRHCRECGRVEMQQPRTATSRNRRDRVREMRQLRCEEICIQLAGQAAVRRVWGNDSRASMARDDYEKVIGILGLLAHDPPQEALTWATLEMEAETRLSIHWSTVEALALRLRSHNRLSARSAGRFFRQCQAASNADRPQVVVKEEEVDTFRAERRAMLLSLLPDHVGAAFHGCGAVEA